MPFGKLKAAMQARRNRKKKNTNRTTSSGGTNKGYLSTLREGPAKPSNQ